MDNLTEYRLANAKEKLESAKLLLDAGKYKDSIGLFLLCNIYFFAGQFYQKMEWIFLSMQV